MAELMRQPGVGGHVGHHPRAVQEAGLRGNAEEGRGGDHDRDHEPGTEPELRGQGRIQGLAVLGMHAEQRVGQEQAARRHGEGERHVDHRPLGRGDFRLAHHLDAVGDRFDARIGAGPLGIGLAEDLEESQEAERGVRRAEILLRRGRDGRDLARVAEEGDAEEDRMARHEEEEDRHQHVDRFLDAAEIQDDQDDDRQGFQPDLRPVPSEINEAEDLVRAGGDRYGDRQDVIH